MTLSSRSPSSQKSSPLVSAWFAVRDVACVEDLELVFAPLCDLDPLELFVLALLDGPDFVWLVAFAFDSFDVGLSESGWQGEKSERNEQSKRSAKPDVPEADSAPRLDESDKESIM